MGNSSTKEAQFGLGHPERFYKGCAAVNDGSYTFAEVYFNQAMTSHPGHAFWTRLMDIAITKGRDAKESGEKQQAENAKADVPSPTSAAAETRKSRPQSTAMLPTVLVTAGERRTSVFRDGDAAKEKECGVADVCQATPLHPPPVVAASDDANMSLNGSAAELDSKPTLVLPVDHRLADVQDYVRMLTDIGRIYRRKAADSTGDSREMACRLSMLYNAYTAVRLQALLTVFRGHFAAQNTSGDARAEDMFQIYSQCAMSAQWGNSAAFRTEVNHAKSVTGLTEVRQSSKDQAGGAEEGERSQAANLCIFWHSVQYLFTMNVVLYGMSSMGLLHWSENGMSPATQKAVVEMSLRCFGLILQDLSQTAEANSHVYLGAIAKKFSAVLAHYVEECRLTRDGEASSELRSAAIKHPQRTVKGLEPKFLVVKTANLAEVQSAFMRTAMPFPLMTLPLLDTSKVSTVELQLHHNGNRHRPVKLMTPMERSYGWYTNMSFANRFEHQSGKPGESAFLLHKCLVSPGATVKDPSMFTCVGLEEWSSIVFPMAVGCGVVLQRMGKREEEEGLERATLQFAIDLYGDSSPISQVMEALFDHIKEDNVFVTDA